MHAACRQRKTPPKRGFDALQWPCLDGNTVVAVVAEINPRIVDIVNLYRKNFIFFNGHGLIQVSFTFTWARGFSLDQDLLSRVAMP